MNRTELTVVKIGGNVIDDRAALEAFAADFARLPGRKVLVHGGGRLATELSARLGLSTRMIDGRRVTDAATLRVAAMVYAGWINKSLVALLQADACNALGLSGADGGAIRSVRRAAAPVDYGYVGDIPADGVDADLVASLIEAGIVPVFCAITHDARGELLNTNADSVASAVAMALSSRYRVRLVFCFEKQGVLADPSDADSVIAHIEADGFERLRASGAVGQGMIPKIENALRAVAAGVARVEIKHSSALLTGGGTAITASRP